MSVELSGYDIQPEDFRVWTHPCADIGGEAMRKAFAEHAHYGASVNDIKRAVICGVHSAACNIDRKGGYQK